MCTLFLSLSKLHKQMGALLIGLALSSHAAAQAFPNRPINLIVAYAAGGITDIAFRQIGQEMAKTLGQSIVIENRTGAGGRIGAEAIIRAPKDGYTIGVFNSAIGTNLPLMSPDFKLEPGKDYTPISSSIETYVVMVTNPSMPFRDVKGVIDYARANPGKLNFASSGAGTTGHLSFELLRYATGIDATHVPFKGDAPAFSAVAGGQVQMSITSGTVKPFVDSGKVIGIAVTSAKRWSLFPNLPSIQESGIKDFEASAWQGLVGPPGLPPDVVNRLNRSTVEALKDAELRRKLVDMGLVVGSSTPEEFTNFIKADLAKWTPIFKAANIKPE